MLPPSSPAQLQREVAFSHRKTLKDWMRKNGSHANLASATFDTQAQDKKTEASKVLQELAEKAKEKVG
jgi:hypothetical protein